VAGTRKDTPNDPARRARILEAALDVIADGGVHRATHRRIAARAGVPLGSLTYYFAGLDDLLASAFASLADRMAEQYRGMLEAARTRSEAEEAVVAVICGPEYGSDREMALLFEMYAYGNHNPAVAETARLWLLRSRESLGLHFPPRTCLALDALVEGWPMHREFEHAPLDRALVAATVRTIVAGLGEAV